MMPRISSGFYPPVHHLLRKYNWRKGALALGLVVMASIVTGLWLLVIPTILLVSCLAGISFLAFEIGVTNLAINVWDGGDYLEIERRGESLRIPLSQFVDASYAGRWNPPRVYLRLRTPCKWGLHITFVPDLSAGRQRARQVVADLNDRIARTTQT